MLSEKTLTKNLKAIKKHSPGIAHWIETSEKLDWIDVIKSRNNENNLLISSEGKTKTAYSMDDPTNEANTVIKPYKFSGDDVSVLIGAGLGYMTKAIRKTCHKDHRTIIVESNGDMVRQMLSHFDFSKELEKQLILIAGPGKMEVAFIIGAVEIMINTEDWIVIAETYTRMRPMEYGKLMLYTNEIINQIRCNTGTVASSGKKMADNDIACLPYVIRHRGIKELEQLYQDMPTVLVSTGPSLAKNIHILKKYQHRVIIIAVAQALRPLLAYDIRPDFICTVDFGEINYGHFKGLMHENIPLIATSRTYAPLLKNYQGPMFIVATPNASNDATAANIIIDKGWCDAGGSVAHLCLGVAQLLGCSPIIMIGQDLALGKASHFEQVDESGKIEVRDGMIMWKVTDSRSILKGQEYTMGPAIMVPGYYGSPVITNVGLASFLTSFEGMIANKTTKIINATQGGAFIKGADHMHLREAIKQYCKTNLRMEKTRIEKYLSYADNADELIEKAIPLLEKDIENLNKIIKHASIGIAADDKMISIIDGKGKKKKGKLREQLSRNEKASLLAQELAKHNPLVTLAIYGASRRIQSTKLRVNASLKHLLQNYKDLQTRITRNKIILETAKQASKDLLNTYTDSFTLLKKYQETKNDSLLRPVEEEPIILDDSEELFAIGNFAKPLLEAKRALEKNAKDKKAIAIRIKALAMRCEQIKQAVTNDNTEEVTQKRKKVRYNQLIEKSRELGRDHQKYDEALVLIKEAMLLLPAEEAAHWGLATVYHQLGQFNLAEEEYKKLIELAPHNYRYLFELGQVQLRQGKILEGLTTCKKAMSKTDEFDSFLAHTALMLSHEGKFAEALEDLDAYLIKFPSDYVAMTSKGMLLKKMDRIQEAKDILETVLRLKPNFNEAKTLLSSLVI